MIHFLRLINLNHTLCFYLDKGGNHDINIPKAVDRFNLLL
jgi:hypothetical protein